jgi:Amt family ammonium transporter
MVDGEVNFNSFFGGLGKAFMAGVGLDSLVLAIPESVFATFQMTFAIITPALIVGAFAERMKFSSMLVFLGLWFTIVYTSMTHMVWSGDGALMWDWGVLDFAGGTVVHINAGIAGLVGALLLGNRVGFGTASMAPHNVPLVMVGASLLWVGWFGFNVGSGLEANGFAGMVFANTILATAAAALAWSFAEWIHRGTPTMLGAASGAVAGLVAITPACGWVGPMGAIVIGLVAGLICLWAVASLKRKLGYDDSLDVFGVHCVGGIIGALLTAVFCSPSLGGTGVYDYVANAVGEYSMATQFKSQLIGVVVSLVWSGVVAAIAFKIVDLVVGLRVSEDDERQGLDTVSHGERAYN